MTESEKELTNSGYRLLTPDQADYENFLSETSFPIIRTRSNGDGTGAPFFLALFRLWLFLLAIASQLALCHLVLPCWGECGAQIARAPPVYM